MCTCTQHMCTCCALTAYMDENLLFSKYQVTKVREADVKKNFSLFQTVIYAKEKI